MKKLIGYQRGVNLGGWLSQGSKEKEHLDTFILEEDVKRIASMGCDHLRLPVDFENIYDDNGAKERGLKYIDNCISWCRKYHLNVVLDLHKTPGYIFDDPKYSADFFGNPKKEALFLDIWDILSKRYAKYSDMMMLELLNEVTLSEYLEPWNALGLRAIEVIRKNSPTVKVLFGGIGYSATGSVKYMPLPPDENIVYNIHCYEPLIFTHQGAYWFNEMPLDFRVGYPFVAKDYYDFMMSLSAAKYGPFNGHPELEVNPQFFIDIFREPVEVCEARGVSLYCGEYGVIDLADPDSSLLWLKDIHTAFEHFGIGRALWNYKEKDFGVIGEHYAPIYDEFIKYL